MAGRQSTNFEFLRTHRGELADLGAFAEAYAYSDPVSSLVKLRLFAEVFVTGLYSHLKLPRPFQANLNDLLNEECFRQSVPSVIINKIHILRKAGNSAAHSNYGSSQDALCGLQSAFDLARWIHISLYKGSVTSCGEYKAPLQTNIHAAVEAEKKKLKEQLALQEAEMQQLLQKLEEERKTAEAHAKTAAELQSVLDAGQKAADTLKFDEAKTRKELIDAMLLEVGWNIDPSGVSTEQVGQEIEVNNQPTTSGLGYADYVLWAENGKPLAVIEAKKTAVSPERGRTQAKLYADSLEAKYGQRPVIFYSNGFETFIWNDAVKEPPRKIFGFYSKDSLDYLLFRNLEKAPLETIAPDPQIAGRLYQIEAVKRVCERFSGNHRRSLVIQATGTGKTRVAISLCEALVRAKWAKRILFLCDRRELRKQALNAFKEFLPGEPRTTVSHATYKDRNKRIYLATYPAMMKCLQSFDVGFFDLIIADESHRSIYNRYRDLFTYFDALEVGLTATPVQFIARNTYKMFGCEDKDPTSYFSFEDAINHRPPYLTPFEVITHTTGFLREGIKYSQMNEEQKRQLEEQLEDPEVVEYDEKLIDRFIYNKDTNRIIIRNLMENGIRDATGGRPGKTIVFARNHKHALLMQEVFDELYPQYGGLFCQVIDNYDPRAEQLIDDFKGQGGNTELTIAISVDMLDTGIDVPEVVNLVFAKPVKSYVKFWQMIGRGTRLCQNLFGPGKDKEKFRIFDHWANFEFFDESYKPVEPAKTKSLLQRVFESRVCLAETALQKGKAEAFDLAITLIGQDIAALPNESISVKEKWREIKSLQEGRTLQDFNAPTRHSLKNDAASLMQWRDSRGDDEAYNFDLLLTDLQTALLMASASFADLKDKVVDAVFDLPININQVRNKLALVEEVKAAAFWQNPTVSSLEKVRTELRGIMKYRRKKGGEPLPPPTIDVSENPDLIEIDTYNPKLEGLSLVAYRKRVEEVLKSLFNTVPALQKIRSGVPVTDKDIEALCSTVLTQNPDVDLKKLAKFFPEVAGNLQLLIRGLIGLDAQAVHKQFESFVQDHAALSAKQMRFLDLLMNHISQNGGIELDELYEPPFTLIDSDGFDGVFPEEALANELIGVISSFSKESKVEQVQV